MSNDPLMYQSQTVASVRPTAVTVLSILGIVFSGLGLLCGGLGLVSSVFISAVKSTNVGPMPVPGLSIALGIVAFLLAGLLLIASIGSLQLKPQARKLMIGWALADIAFDTAKVVLSAIFIFPIALQRANSVNANNAAVVRGMMIGGAIIGWIFAVAFAVIVWIFFKSKTVTAAFERGAVGYDPIMQSTIAPLSPPPPPGNE